MDAVLRSRVVACIGETLETLGVLEGETVDEETGLFGRGIGLDSIETLRIVLALEERFDLAIEDDALDAEHFRTVGSLVGFVEGQLA